MILSPSGSLDAEVKDIPLPLEIPLNIKKSKPKPTNTSC